MKNILVVTSWDDGHKDDLRVAKLLKKYHLNGIFYVSPKDREFEKKDLLTDKEILFLSKNFEIGAHTMTHPELTRIGKKEANDEIISSKKYLEKITGKKINSFCYPRGQYTKTNVEQVKEAGYKNARITKTFAFDSGNKNFETPTTIHAYDHWSDLLKVLEFADFNPVLFFKYYAHWDELAKAMFDRISKEGGVFHLWGHSWEINKHNDWERLEGVFKYIYEKQK